MKRRNGLGSLHGEAVGDTKHWRGEIRRSPPLPIRDDATLSDSAELPTRATRFDSVKIIRAGLIRRGSVRAACAHDSSLRGKPLERSAPATSAFIQLNFRRPGETVGGEGHSLAAARVVSLRGKRLVGVETLLAAVGVPPDA
jgi:hypothetical protein